MDKNKSFRPLSIPFVTMIVLLNLIIVGLLVLTIIGFIKLNWIYIIIGIPGFILLLWEDITLLSWKITFIENYMIVPSSNFDRFLFGKKEIQKINYVDIEKIELKKSPVQILIIQCKNRKNPNLIYVKQFSKKQVEQIQKELNLRINKFN